MCDSNSQLQRTRQETETLQASRTEELRQQTAPQLQDAGPQTLPVAAVHTAAVRMSVLDRQRTSEAALSQPVQTFPPLTKEKTGFWKSKTYQKDAQYVEIARLAEEYNTHLQDAPALVLERRNALMQKCSAYLMENSVKNSQHAGRVTRVENLMCDLLANDSLKALAEEQADRAADACAVNLVANTQMLISNPDQAANEIERMKKSAGRIRSFFKDSVRRTGFAHNTSRVQSTLITRILTDSSFAAPTQEQMERLDRGEKLEPVQPGSDQLMIGPIGNNTELRYSPEGVRQIVSGSGNIGSDNYMSGNEKNTIGSMIHELTHAANASVYQNSMLTLGIPKDMSDEQIRAISKHREEVLQQIHKTLESTDLSKYGFLKSDLQDRLKYMGLVDKAKTTYFKTIPTKLDNLAGKWEGDASEPNPWIAEKAQVERYAAVENVNFTTLIEYDACMAQTLHYFETTVDRADLTANTPVARLYRMFKAAALETFSMRAQYKGA